MVNLKDLKNIKKEICSELEIAEQKKRQTEKLLKEIDEEVSARKSLLFSIDRMIDLQ